MVFATMREILLKADSDFMRALADPAYAWLDVSPAAAAKAIVRCIAELETVRAR